MIRRYFSAESGPPMATLRPSKVIPGKGSVKLVDKWEDEVVGFVARSVGSMLETVESLEQLIHVPRPTRAMSAETRIRLRYVLNRAFMIMPFPLLRVNTTMRERRIMLRSSGIAITSFPVKGYYVMGGYIGSYLLSLMGFPRLLLLIVQRIRKKQVAFFITS